MNDTVGITGDPQRATQSDIGLRAVRTLLGKRFYIPSYQRGYRWDTEQVKQLLNDLLEFEEKQDTMGQFYCLQPIVVAPLPLEKYPIEWQSSHEPVYEVIDGQQRLTTILLILQYLREQGFSGKDLYAIRYETRNTSVEFLTNIKEKSEEDAQSNADYWHIYYAYNAITDWFEYDADWFGYDADWSKYDDDHHKLCNIIFQLLNNSDKQRNTRIIWYEVSEHEDRINIFNRLNIGKIPLTDAELIRALFLRQGNFGSSSPTLEQEQIASAWDDMERKLQRSSFWSFLHNATNDSKYSNRINILFDLITELEETSRKKHSSFEHFSLKLNEPEADIHSVWLQVKQCFLRLEEWYENHQLYHYIGYLIATGKKLSDLYELSQGETKQEFISLLKAEIKKGLKGITLEELDYINENDRKKIRSVLLLFNIESVLQSSKADTRFPFDQYKEGQWDVEHIRSQSGSEKGQGQIEFLKASLDYFESKPNLEDEEERIKDKISKLIAGKSNKKSKIQEEFEKLSEKLFEELQELLGEASGWESINGLGNLTLLDYRTNRGYGNSPFVFKRKRIIENDKQGIFTPLATKNAFLKYYSLSSSDVLVWSEDDARDYLKAIEDTLSEYFSE